MWRDTNKMADTSYQGAVKTFKEITYFRMGEISRYAEYIKTNERKVIASVWTNSPMGTSGLDIRLNKILGRIK